MFLLLVDLLGKFPVEPILEFKGFSQGYVWCDGCDRRCVEPLIPMMSICVTTIDCRLSWVVEVLLTSLVETVHQQYATTED